jgi:hypothetical protein
LILVPKTLGLLKKCICVDGDMAQAVEHLSSQVEVWSTNLITTKRKKERKYLIFLMIVSKTLDT